MIENLDSTYIYNVKSMCYCCKQCSCTNNCNLMQTVYILKNYHATYVLFESAGFIYEYVNKSKKFQS